MIPHQVNEGGIVALLPDGRVEFLHPAVATLLAPIRTGGPLPTTPQLEPFILDSPLVRMENFHLAAPAIAFIEVTNLCNLRCEHCYAWSGPKRPDEMSSGTIKQLIDDLAEMGVLQLFLTGGEIFSHPDAIDLITHARSKPISLQIFTNGLLITEDMLAAIPRGTSFFISFDTARPERTVRGKMDFPTLRRLFGWMRDHGHVFRTAVSVHSRNIEDVEEIFEWCAENDFPRPQWLETHPIGRALLHPDIMLRPEQVEAVFAVYKRCMERYSAPPDEVSAGEDSGAASVLSIDTIKFCQRLERATGQEKCGRSMAYVNSAGDVYPCSNCMSSGMHRAGNVHEERFPEIWETGFDSIRAVRFDDHKDCESCPVHQAGIWCQFRCPPLAQNVSRDPLGCGATEYLRLFMLRAGAFWAERRRDGVRLTMAPTQRERTSEVVP